MLYLSQAIGRPVRDQNGDPIGKVADLIVAVGERYPPVTGLVIATDGRQIFLPWSSVESLDVVGGAPAHLDARHHQVRPAPGRDPAARGPDGQADRRHRRAARRARQRHQPRRGRGLAPPRRGRRRRGRAAPPARASRARSGRSGATSRCPLRERYIDWEDVDPVESSIASVKLRVPHGAPGRAAPGGPRLDHRPARRRRTAPASSPRSTTRPSPTRSRRWSPTRRSRCSRTSSRSAPPTSSRR